MQTECRPSVDYPCLDCEAAAEAHDVHPFFDRPSWQDGFARGHSDGFATGHYGGVRAVCSDLLSHVRCFSIDLHLGLYGDLSQAQVLHEVTRFVEQLRAEARDPCEGDGSDAAPRASPSRLAHAEAPGERGTAENCR